MDSRGPRRAAPTAAPIDDKQAIALARLTLLLRNELMVYGYAHLPSFAWKHSTDTWPFGEPLERHVESVAIALSKEDGVVRDQHYLYVTEDSTSPSTTRDVDLDQLYELVTEEFLSDKEKSLGKKVCVFVRPDFGDYHRWKEIELDSQREDAPLEFRLINRMDLSDVSDITKKKRVVLYDSSEMIKSEKGLLQENEIQPALLEWRGSEIPKINPSISAQLFQQVA